MAGDHGERDGIMWTREELKSNAKLILKRTYWMSFVACLIMGILGAGGGGTSIANVSGNSSNQQNDMSFFSSDGFYQILPVVSVLLIVVLAASVVFSILVSGPVMVGGKRFFMSSREENPSLSDLFYAFTSGNYFNVVKTMFFVGLYTFLWSLLFVIPGIIKSYEYFFVPYILSENPGIDTKRAFELSREMSAGKKWDMFVLDWSFFGWYLLGALCCGVGVFFVRPYYHATIAEMYTASRAYVLYCGRASSWELPGYHQYSC
jgi:uncharacterized membrane protein